MSNVKHLKMLSETKCTKSFFDNFFKRYEVFLLEPFYILYIDNQSMFC